MVCTCVLNGDGFVPVFSGDLYRSVFSVVMVCTCVFSGDGLYLCFQW